MNGQMFRHHGMRLLLVVVLTAAACDGLYHTSGDTLKWLEEAARSKPELIKHEAHRPSADVREDFITITNFAGGQAAAAPKKHILIVASEHAREIITSEVALALAKLLVGDADGQEMLEWPEMVAALREHLKLTGPDLKAAWAAFRDRLLGAAVVKMAPIVNLGGRQLFEGGQMCLRKTPNAVDLNRNWPYAWRKGVASEIDYGGSQPFSEPQTKTLRDIAAAFKPDVYVNIHSGEWAAYVPWDSKRDYAPNQPDDMQALMDRYEAICDCVVGPAGAVSGYLAYGTSMDYFYTELKVPYSLTLEVYGARVGSSRAPGKLPAGMKNQRLAAFVPKRPARAPRLVPKRLARRLLSGGATVTNDAVLAVMGKRPYMDQKCFQDFNPTSEQAYRDAVAKWVVALLVTCQHVTRVAA